MPPFHPLSHSRRTVHAEAQIQALRETYLRLLNETLPAAFTQPVRFNHCFARIVLDRLFADCWYNHLSAKAPAYKQLNEAQLTAAIERMNAWLKNPALLSADNEASLRYRGKGGGRK